jgi:hypothetical protein
MFFKVTVIAFSFLSEEEMAGTDNSSVDFIFFHARRLGIAICQRNASHRLLSLA